MKNAIPRMALAWLAIWLPMMASVSLGATGTGTSGDVRVDTRATDAVAPTFTFLCFRSYGGNVIENATPAAGVDTALKVRGTNPADLLKLPIVVTDQDGFGGVVADGVTPLLIVVSAPAGLGAARTYMLNAQSWNGSDDYSGDAINTKLLVLKNRAFSPSLTITLSPAEPRAFILVNPLDPEKIDHNPYGDGYSPLRVTLALTETGSNRQVGDTTFKVRKPPVVLVHGFNADGNTWSPEFVDVLKAERGDDFVIQLNYGAENNNELNTTASVKDNITLLDDALKRGVESEFPGWDQDEYAWTRYDAVGHSQGGVLLRFLCSSNADSFTTFRSKSNHFRGRFRRVVTVGSPHAGSTMCELALRLHGSLVWGSTKARFADAIGKFDPERVFQKKFRVGNRSELHQLNAQYTCDGNARLHPLRTAVDSAAAPASGGHLFYKALWLTGSTPSVNGKTPGQVVAPLGSDGVVDSRSQSAGMATSSFLANGDYCHAAYGNTQTNSVAVAQRVIELLDGPASQFGPVTIPQSLAGYMETARQEIQQLATAIVALHRPEPEPLYVTTPAVILKQSLASTTQSSSGGASPRAALYSTETLDFTLQAPEGESPDGPVNWFAVVYGPDGITADGLMLATSGENAEQLALTVDASVVGDVVLQVSFLSTTGNTVSGASSVVLSRAPGSVRTGIEIEPAALFAREGAEIPLEIWAVFDGSIRSRLFAADSEFEFTSSDESIASVAADGRVALLAEGTATITATYNGTHTATCAVTVLGPVPTITSATAVAAVTGAPTSYQITASGGPTEFTATALPEGLDVDTATGLVSGAPTTNGIFTANVGATNATGTGWAEVVFTVDPGSAQPPTDIGIEAAAIPANQSAGIVVGALTASDPNPADTVFGYALAAGEGADDNGLFAISGGNLVTTASIDPATHPVCKIRVRCTDAGGLFLEKTFEFPVLGAPVITTQPKDVRAFAAAADGAALGVTAIGIEPLSYQWHRNGEDVDWSTDAILSLYAEPASAGTWTVTVSNAYGSVTSDPAVVTVDPQSFGWWAEENESSLGANAGPMDDGFGVGIPNILVFAMAGTSATWYGAGRDVLPRIVSENGQLVLEYLKARSAGPSRFKVMRSGNLATWNEFIPDPADVTTLSYEDPEWDRYPYWDSDLIRITLPGTARDFFRIEVAE